jgi:hypothetical protein
MGLLLNYKFKSSYILWKIGYYKTEVIGVPRNTNKSSKAITPQSFDGNKIPPQLDGTKESQSLNNYIGNHLTNLSKAKKTNKD